MALKTKVKVGQVTNLSEARYCAGMGVDLLGFPIGSQPDQLSLDQAKEIIGWIAGPQLVFEMNPCLDAHALQQVTGFSPDCPIEMSMEHLSMECAATLGNHPLILSAEYQDRMDLIKKSAGLNVKYIILKSDNSNMNWDEIGLLNAHIPVLIAYHGPGQLSELIQHPITGIALSGTAESKPGLKEYNHLADILEALETD